jgi:predicted  nucleic acid-binding Zn-ribbon protein
MIRKTIRTLLLGGAALAAIGYLLFGRAFPSYLGTAVDSARAAVADHVPVDLEIRRAEGLIRQIDPQIETCKRDLARAEVDLEELTESVGRLEKSVATDERRLRAGAERLKGDTKVVALASAGEALRRTQAGLERAKDSYVNDAAMLKTRRALVERQTNAVAAARERLEAVRLERAALDDQLHMLRTQRLHLEALAAASTRCEIDDSALGRAKEALTGIKKRLDVAQRVLENDLAFHGEPAAAPTASRDIVREIDELFAGDATAAPAVAVEYVESGGR